MNICCTLLATQSHNSPTQTDLNSQLTATWKDLSKQSLYAIHMNDSFKQSFDAIQTALAVHLLRILLSFLLRVFSEIQLLRCVDHCRVFKQTQPDDIILQNEHPTSHCLNRNNKVQKFTSNHKQKCKR